LLVLPLLVSACNGSLKKSSEGGETKVEYYMVDGVKNIRSDTTDNLSPETYREDYYTLSSESRLLLRFENLASYNGKIVLGEKDHIWIRVVLSERTNIDQALKTMRLCSLTKNWMMMATWKYAHPFSKAGQWSRAGADYDPASCVQAVADPGKKLPGETSPMDQRAIYFNISRWYLDVFKGRGGNIGHVLMVDGGEAEILGDNSVSYAPRIQWSEATVLD
jgi:hypothetical protein